jgi:hypothetical protein
MLYSGAGYISYLDYVGYIRMITKITNTPQIISPSGYPIPTSSVRLENEPSHGTHDLAGIRHLHQQCPCPPQGANQLILLTLSRNPQLFAICGTNRLISTA